jgi:hypothetical protein
VSRWPVGHLIKDEFFGFARHFYLYAALGLINEGVKVREMGVGNLHHGLRRLCEFLVRAEGTSAAEAGAIRAGQASADTTLLPAIAVNGES